MRTGRGGGEGGKPVLKVTVLLLSFEQETAGLPRLADVSVWMFPHEGSFLPTPANSLQSPAALITVSIPTSPFAFRSGPRGACRCQPTAAFSEQNGPVVPRCCAVCLCLPRLLATSRSQGAGTERGFVCCTSMLPSATGQPGTVLPKNSLPCR